MGAVDAHAAKKAGRSVEMCMFLDHPGNELSIDSCRSRRSTDSKCCTKGKLQAGECGDLVVCECCIGSEAEHMHPAHCLRIIQVT